MASVIRMPNAAVQGAETAATPLFRLPCNGLFGVRYSCYSTPPPHTHEPLLILALKSSPVLGYWHGWFARQTLTQRFKANRTASKVHALRILDHVRPWRSVVVWFQLSPIQLRSTLENSNSVFKHGGLPSRYGTGFGCSFKLLEATPLKGRFANRVLCNEPCRLCA